jgi:hypothetical protein
MNDSSVSQAQEAERTGLAGATDGPGWLLLMHQLPAVPAYLRVKIHRRLRAVGAIGLKNAAYLLPDTDAAREDFHWILEEIVSGGGEATLAKVAFLSGPSRDGLLEAFMVERNQEYAEIAALAGSVMEAGSTRRDGVRLRRRLREVVERDHLGAPGRAAAEHAVSRVEQGEAAGVEADSLVRERPAGEVWVTRRGVRVDRMSSAWLIRRFIDGGARFRFVEPESYEAEPGELRFDMFEGEFTHEGERCTFETLVARFDLCEGGLRAVGEIVHDIDLKEDRYGRIETAGVASVLAGIAAMHERDEDRIEAAAPLFDGLLAHFRALSS